MTDSWVYFLRMGDFVKIGVSRDPRTRTRRIVQAPAANSAPPAAVVNRAPADLLCIVPGSKATEAAFHAAFWHLHEQGEWFRWDEAFNDLACRVDSSVLWEPPLIPYPPLIGPQPESAPAPLVDF